MARPNTIPDNLLTPIMKRMAAGSNAQEVVDWLKKEHDLDVSTRVVSQRVYKFRRLENEAKKLAIQEAASKSALDCVYIIDTNIVLLNQEAIKLLKHDDIATKLAGKQLAETTLKYIDKKMNLTGMDKEELTDSEEELIEGLLKKLGE